MSNRDDKIAFSRNRAMWREQVNLCRDIPATRARIGCYWADKHVNRETASSYVAAATVARAFGVHPKTVERAFKDLAAHGFIEITDRWGQRGRVRRMIFKKIYHPIGNGDDFGHQSPKSEASLEADLGHSDARPRTNEGRSSDTQVRQTNEPIEPSERADMSKQSAAKLTSGSQTSVATFEQTSVPRRRRLRDIWESRIRGECRKADVDKDYRLLRDEDREWLAWSLEFGHCKLVDVVAEVRKLRNARNGPGRPTDTP